MSGFCKGRSNDANTTAGFVKSQRKAAASQGNPQVLTLSYMLGLWRVFGLLSWFYYQALDIYEKGSSTAGDILLSAAETGYLNYT
jgi:hypothetical protein